MTWIEEIEERLDNALVAHGLEIAKKIIEE